MASSWRISAILRVRRSSSVSVPSGEVYASTCSTSGGARRGGRGGWGGRGGGGGGGGEGGEGGSWSAQPARAVPETGRKSPDLIPVLSHTARSAHRRFERPTPRACRPARRRHPSRRR